MQRLTPERFLLLGLIVLRESVVHGQRDFI